MLAVIVRAGSDASAVKSALRPHYGVEGLGYEVVSAGGVRGEALARRVAEEASRRKHSYVIALLGREDGYLADEMMELVPSDLFSVITLRKCKVRNARRFEILKAVELGKAMIRNKVCWSSIHSCYRLGSGDTALDFPRDAISDPFIIYGSGLKALSSLIGARITGSALLVRRDGGRHIVFVKENRIAELRFDDESDKPSVLWVNSRNDTLAGANYTCIGKLNEARLARIEHVGIEFLRRVSEGLGVKKVVVPLSGGKDSAATLNIAVKAFGNERVRAIYVDTGINFKVNREHSERLASLLNVELDVVRAPVREEIAAGRRLPTHKDRWCTRLKVSALIKRCAELAGGQRALIVTGSRDSESRARELEPYVDRVSDKLYKVAPIRHWSTIECQAYCMSRSLPLNPLYSLGFYRIGCSICPSLRSWERFIIRLFANTIKPWVERSWSSNKSRKPS